jgi:hypothetical protein
MTPSAMAEGPHGMRRRPGLAWRVAKMLYRRSIRWRARVPLLHTLFTEKEQMLNLAMQYVAFNRLPGDYLEFGCYEGNSFIAAYHFAQAQGLGTMRFFAFDSFRGLPEAQGVDVDSADTAQYVEGDFACDSAAFQRHLRSSGVSLGKVQLIEGYYRDSLHEGTRAELSLRSAAIVLVDCDLYEATRQVLDFVAPVLDHGSVLIFDDWYNFRGDPRRGEQLAFAEWLKSNRDFTASRYLACGWHGLSFLLHHRR